MNPRPFVTSDSATAEMCKELLVEVNGVEPMTPCLQSRCSSQLSYTPIDLVAVGSWQGLKIDPQPSTTFVDPTRFELVTPTLSV